MSDPDPNVEQSLYCLRCRFRTRHYFDESAGVWKCNACDLVYFNKKISEIVSEGMKK